MNARQSDRARLFNRLHAEGILLLANVYNHGDARLVESLGAKTIATRSAGVAWSLGFVDGGHLPVRLLVETVERIARVIQVPLLAVTIQWRCYFWRFSAKARLGAERNDSGIFAQGDGAGADGVLQRVRARGVGRARGGVGGTS